TTKKKKRNQHKEAACCRDKRKGSAAVEGLESSRSSTTRKLKSLDIPQEETEPHLQPTFTNKGVWLCTIARKHPAKKPTSDLVLRRTWGVRCASSTTSIRPPTHRTRGVGLRLTEGVATTPGKIPAFLANEEQRAAGEGNGAAATTAAGTREAGGHLRLALQREGGRMVADAAEHGRDWVSSKGSARTGARHHERRGSQAVMTLVALDRKHQINPPTTHSSRQRRVWTDERDGKDISSPSRFCLAGEAAVARTVIRKTSEERKFTRKRRGHPSKPAGPPTPPVKTQHYEVPKERGAIIAEHSDSADRQTPNAFHGAQENAFELGKAPSDSPLSPKEQPKNLLKTTGNFVSLVSKALNNSAASNEPPYIRGRQEADKADKAYCIAVRRLDRHRLALEERIKETLKLLQRWESKTLRAVKTAAYQPESDLTALIEQYRGGLFRPSPQIYESVAHDESDVVFGIDLPKWAEGGWYKLTQGGENGKTELIPLALTALLSGLDAAYQRVPNDIEKRKAWIYEVSLPAGKLECYASRPGVLLAKFDAPVIASCVKLWLLKLNPPIALYEGWEDFRRIYSHMGSTSLKTDTYCSCQHCFIEAPPRPFQSCNLVETTKVDEADEVYSIKLALLSNSKVHILHPSNGPRLKRKSQFKVVIPHHYDALLPPTIARKKRESERRVPVRKRTAPVDVRLSRSRSSMGADAQPPPA
ncbi:LOW QUALITY PROTEIN: hypothetical protein CVT26_005958, partial [Gymnopilus dilepis]